jgi:hypothetical protein
MNDYLKDRLCHYRMANIFHQKKLSFVNGTLTYADDKPVTNDELISFPFGDWSIETKENPRPGKIIYPVTKEAYLVLNNTSILTNLVDDAKYNCYMEDVILFYKGDDKKRMIVPALFAKTRFPIKKGTPLYLQKDGSKNKIYCTDRAHVRYDKKNIESFTRFTISRTATHFVSGDIVSTPIGEYAFVLLYKKHTCYSAILAPLEQDDELTSVANLMLAFFYDSPKDIEQTEKKIDGYLLFLQ